MSATVAETRFTPQTFVTYIITAIGIGLLAFGLFSLNNWLKIDPNAVAQDRVDRAQGLNTAERSQLFEAQLDVAIETKGNLARQGLIFILIGIAVLWLSRFWENWRVLLSEEMLYAYAFLLPPVGWILYFTYPTDNKPTREIIRRNIGVMSLALVGGFIIYYLIIQIQSLGMPDPTTKAPGGIVDFFLAPQIPQLAGIAVGGYIAFRTRDVRAIAVALQLVVLALVLAFFTWLIGNAIAGIERQNLSATDFSFLQSTAGFDIGETLIEYDRNSTYGEAFIVGTLNTLMLSVLGIIFASILGLFVGIARLSTNWLTSVLARIFVELMRNIPLLVLLFFLYAGVLLQLPTFQNTLRFLGGRILLNNRGIALPWFKPTDNFNSWLPFFIIALIIAGVVWYYRNRTYETTGRPAFTIWYVILAFAVVAGLGIVLMGPFVYQTPEMGRLNYAKDENDTFLGLVLSPEFFGVLMGLVLYTGAYIGEVVRAGIQSVSKGQREAASALGLSTNQSLQLIILPQALQVIIPPLTNQYLNLAKNSSLAIAIGYSDLFSVANTTFNQSGQSVQVILMIMSSYLFISLSISFIMNKINQRVKIKER